MNKTNFIKLSQRLKYTFHSPKLLEQALTHRSVGVINNERMEFLGDSIVNFIVAHLLFELFPDKSEGKLSRIRSYLVKGDTLAELSQEIQLGDFLYLGQGELKSGGHNRVSILSGTLEAIFAAIYLDGGFDAVKKVISQLYLSRLEEGLLESSFKDYKTLLQERLQGEKKPLPQYQLIRVTGQEHDQTFYIQCHIDGQNGLVEGIGSSRRRAEQEAARKVLMILQKK